MTSAVPRPRIVDVAFGLWLVAAVLLIADGLWLVWVAVPAFYRGAGGIFVAAGLAVAFLAGRTRRGDKRFQRALVALSLALSLLLVLFVLRGGPLLGAIIAAVLIAGAVLITRSSADHWFDAVDSGGEGD
ncbi:MAG TPA: hypothetical protein VFB19_09340 [Mycobacterium sp.]|nr:hypothetical protein [Mycobacterium sp.]